MTSVTPYRIEGSYYEACNCTAICPCRRQNGVSGGLSTHGICDFLLSWSIERGEAGAIDLTGCRVCLAGSYSDDVDGKPWSVIIYIDERASEEQAEALANIFQGKFGGNILCTSYPVEEYPERSWSGKHPAGRHRRRRGRRRGGVRRNGVVWHSRSRSPGPRERLCAAPTGRPLPLELRRALRVRHGLELLALTGDSKACERRACLARAREV